MATDLTFATDTNVPVASASLFRFSRGHGGLYCSACHGSTHAELASTEANDNVYSQQIQGHVGMIAECTACHTTQPTVTAGGPHGLHPIGSTLSNRVATYHPNPGYVGVDRFTFAAWDGATDSNLGAVDVSVTAGDCLLTLSAVAPAEVQVGVSVPFRAQAALGGCNQPVTFEWTWGDGQSPSASPEVCRDFATPGNVAWQARAAAGTTSKTLSGVVTVKATPVASVPLTLTRTGGEVQIAWPATAVGYLLETTPHLGVATWASAPQTPVVVNGQFIVTVPATAAEQYFRLRQGP